MPKSIEELRAAFESLRDEVLELSELDEITDEQEARLAEAIPAVQEAKAALEAGEKRAAVVAELREAAESGRAAIKDVNFNTKSDNRDRVFDHDDLRYATGAELRDRALTAVEKHLPREASDSSREDTTRLLEKRRGDSDIIARHIIRTSSPEYTEAFEKMLQNPQGAVPEILTDYSARTAMSLTAGNGGYLIPQWLDPTINLTNAGIRNPIRQIASQVSITVDQWDGVNSAGATAEWLAEGTEAADATPTFTAPTITPKKESAWIFGSYEALADTGFDQVGELIADAFDRLEGAGFITGNGVTQPYGLVTQLSGTGPVVAGSSGAAGAADFAKADVYALDNALTDRFRNSCQWLTSQYFANVIRNTADSSYNFWANYGGGVPAELIGYPLYRHTTMGVYPVLGAVGATTITSGSNDYPLILGDFQQYRIVDRIGTAIMYEPMVKSTGNGRPTGQAGWFAFKRCGADVLTSNAFKVLKL